MSQNKFTTILESIQAAFPGKPFVLTIREDETDFWQGGEGTHVDFAQNLAALATAFDERCQDQKLKLFLAMELMKSLCGEAFQGLMLKCASCEQTHLITDLELNEAVGALNEALADQGEPHGTVH